MYKIVEVNFKSGEVLEVQRMPEGEAQAAIAKLRALRPRGFHIMHAAVEVPAPEVTL